MKSNEKKVNLFNKTKQKKNSMKFLVFKCDLCNRIFRSLYQLDQHRNSKIHQNQFQCQYPNCKKIFLYMRNLRHHHK